MAMKRRLRSRLATASLLVAALATARGYAGAPLTAEAVAKQSIDRDTGRDSSAEIRMRLFDRQGRVRERAMTMVTKRGVGAQGDKTLIRFTYPNDIKHTAFLVWEHQDKDDERFLFLPALGRVRRIAGAEKQESFVGSDLSYEDMAGRKLSDYTYTFVSEQATWTTPDGKTHAVWHIESTAVEPGVEYPKSRSMIAKDSLVLLHAELLNRRGERAKVFDVTRLEMVDGFWTARGVVVVNERDKTRTELDTTSIRYNLGLGDEAFSRRELEQRR